MFFFFFFLVWGIFDTFVTVLNMCWTLAILPILPHHSIGERSSRLTKLWSWVRVPMIPNSECVGVHLPLCCLGNVEIATPFKLFIYVFY